MLSKSASQPALTVDDHFQRAAGVDLRGTGREQQILIEGVAGHHEVAERRAVQQELDGQVVAVRTAARDPEKRPRHCSGSGSRDHQDTLTSESSPVH